MRQVSKRTERIVMRVLAGGMLLFSLLYLLLFMTSDGRIAVGEVVFTSTANVICGAVLILRSYAKHYSDDKAS